MGIFSTGKLRYVLNGNMYNNLKGEFLNVQFLKWKIPNV